MSERTIQETQDQILKTALKELERNRDILAGRTFRKYYQLPWAPFWWIPFSLFILTLFNFSTDSNILNAIRFPIAMGIGVAGFTFTILAMGNINKRIDKLVELTGAETKLEEKHYSNIKIITESFPEKESS